MREKRQSQGNGTSTSDVRSGACRYAIAEPVGSEARRSSLVSRHVQRRRRDVADASVLDHLGRATSGSARSRTRACRCLRCGALLKPRQVLWIQVDLTSIVDHHPRILLQELGLRNRLRPALRKHPRSLTTNETSVQHGSVKYVARYNCDPSRRDILLTIAAEALLGRVRVAKRIVDEVALSQILL